MSRTKRIMAAFFALLMLSEAILPTVAYALTSGPSQPEVQGFQPAGVNDMVNLFTGDFSYNISLLDVDGYPINLSYSAGIGMDQEASWVGLGWSLNPGVVERNLRGLPDDFDGDRVEREMGLRPNRTYGLSFNVGDELFGKDIFDALGNVVGHQGNPLTVGISPSFNNYDGPDFEISAGISLQSTTANNNVMTCGLGLKSSANRGLTVSPTVGFDREFETNRMKPGLNFGLSLSSMQGLTNASFGATLRSRKDKNEQWKRITGIGTSFDLGSPTYSPQVTLPMENFSVSLGVTWPLEAPPANHPNFTLGGFYSQQKLATHKKSRPAYGYLHLHEGQDDRNAMLDFNREKDGPYSEDRAGLGLASLTNDVFSVSGQGVAGSYRAYRSEVGHVFDPYNYSGGSGSSWGGEVGVGTGFHLGGDQVINYSSSTSGDWTSGNLTGQALDYRATGNDAPDYEPVFFREANEATVEQDSSLWVAYQQDHPVQFQLSGPSGNNYNLTKNFMHGSGSAPDVNYRRKREPRAQLFSYLDHRHAVDLGLEAPPSHTAEALSDIPGHHISEVTITGKDGGRYVYGVPVYNITQKDVEFSVERNPEPTELPNPESQPGLVSYFPNDVSVDNKKGRDHYYSCTTTPPYAYAFLLSAVLSTDYSDVDGIRGPSDGDLGNYTKFIYTEPGNSVHWRTPVGPGLARWNKGLHGDPLDDKASYVYGEKEVRYLDAIMTRNFIAVFHKSARQDATGVDKDGMLTGDHGQKLDSISLYPKRAYLADNTIAPITRVHFVYDYSLCPNTPTSEATGKGKLTLRKVWFSYGNSQRGVTTPYEFAYGTGPDGNPGYDMRAQDRWGSYKPEGSIPNEEFPYAEQDAATADAHAGAWNLNQVTTPSGGVTSIVYEADDYAFVQDRPAMRMLRLSAFQLYPVIPLPPNGSPPSLREFATLEFNLPPECNGMDENAVQDALFGGTEYLYFRSFVEINSVTSHIKWDYVSGYARIDGVTIDTDNHIGRVNLHPEPIDDGSSTKVNPIYRAGLEFMRLHYPLLVHPGSQMLEDDVVVGASWLSAMVNSVVGFIGQIGAFFQGPNATLGNHAEFCSMADPQKSWIRVNEPDRVKKGGGHRVKSIRISDNWANMEAQETPKAFTYGQDYAYGNEEGGSSGVAAYEPMSGADENPWRQPVYGTRQTGPLTPDERSYQETPFGESLFPGPVVGYSRVVVTDHYPNAQAQLAQGTGREVHEFYTARDFPTITRMTSISPGGRINPRWSIGSLTRVKVVDHMHATQGYVVETNDMHGKPKSVSVFPEGAGPNDAVTVTRYNYAQMNDGSGRLDNAATVIDPQGHIGRAQIGRQYEFVADTREFISKGSSVGMMVNLEQIPVPFLPFLPIILPKYASNSTMFKSAVLVKKIHRFGLLSSVTKESYGSKVSTENLAYDAQTGEVLLTKVNNGFGDPVYAFNFPAYWHYEGMGAAYRNVGIHASLVLDNTGTATVPNAKKLFFPGDVLSLATSTGFNEAWVNAVGDNTVQVVDRTGSPVTGTWPVEVIRSGRRNMQAVNMMSLTLKSNPLEGMRANLYANLLDAKVYEFKDTWRAECACLDPDQPAPNDWLMNRLGMWRPWKDRVWLTDRTRSHYDNNANIRRDGTYTSFSPFYQVLNGQWAKDQAGWTTAREIMDYDSRGHELENRDALGLYASATFGYRGDYETAVAQNARYQEIGFAGFEEASSEDCTDRHFRFNTIHGSVVEGDAHTGRRAVRCKADESWEFEEPVTNCGPSYCKTMIFSTVTESDLFTIASTAYPVTVEYEVLSGQVVLIQNGNDISADGTGSWIAKVTITDAEGCAKTFILNHHSY